MIHRWRVWKKKFINNKICLAKRNVLMEEERKRKRGSLEEKKRERS